MLPRGKPFSLVTVIQTHALRPKLRALHVHHHTLTRAGIDEDDCLKVHMGSLFLILQCVRVGKHLTHMLLSDMTLSPKAEHVVHTGAGGCETVRFSTS